MQVCKIFVKFAHFERIILLSQIASSNKFNDCCGSLIITLKKNKQNSNCLKISNRYKKILISNYYVTQSVFCHFNWMLVFFCVCYLACIEELATLILILHYIWIRIKKILTEYSFHVSLFIYIHENVCLCSEIRASL